MQVAQRDRSKPALSTERVQTVDCSCIEPLQFDGAKLGQDMGADYGLVLR